MHSTEPEMAAARRLAEALVHFLVAIEDANAQRRAERTRLERTVLPAPVTPPPPAAALQAPPLPDRLAVTGREAAELLSISHRTLWTLTAPRGPIPAIRLGRAVRYPVDELSKVISRMKSRR